MKENRETKYPFRYLGLDEDRNWGGFEVLISDLDIDSRGKKGKQKSFSRCENQTRDE